VERRTLKFFLKISERINCVDNVSQRELKRFYTYSSDKFKKQSVKLGIEFVEIYMIGTLYMAKRENNELLHFFILLILYNLQTEPFCFFLFYETTNSIISNDFLQP